MKNEIEIKQKLGLLKVWEDEANKANLQIRQEIKAN